MLTTCGLVIARPQIPGADIADLGPKPLLAICSLEFAIRQICRVAEESGLTHAERGYLLNRLPSPEGNGGSSAHR